MEVRKKEWVERVRERKEVIAVGSKRIKEKSALRQGERVRRRDRMCMFVFVRVCVWEREKGKNG